MHTFRSVINVMVSVNNVVVTSFIKDVTCIYFKFQIPAYDHTKHVILNSGLMIEGIPLHITSSMVAGFCTACTTSPVDVVKTRVMNQCK